MEKNRICGAVDVGGTKISYGLVTFDGKLVFKARLKTDRRGGRAAVNQAVEAILTLKEKAEEAGAELVSVGLCIPGIVDPQTGSVWAPNVKGWIHVPLRKIIAEKISLPVIVIGDRQAYVAGEAWVGAAKGSKDIVFLAVGTGIGAGIISDGRFIDGHNGISGAVGWFGLNRNFKQEYSKLGCFEAEASGSGLARKARLALKLKKDEERKKSIMFRLAGGKIERVTAEVVAEAARQKDKLARKLVRETISFLAMGVANIVSILNPEVVVLGGGLFQAADLFYQPLCREFLTWAQPLSSRAVKLKLSELGQEAALFGCARAAWDQIINKED